MHFYSVMFSQATPIATKPLPALSPSFFARPAEQVAPELIGCLLVLQVVSDEVLLGCKKRLFLQMLDISRLLRR